MTKIVAVAGKGGVGKTSLAGAFVKVLVEKYPDKKILRLMLTLRLDFLQCLT